MSVATMISKMSEGLGRTCGIFFLTLLFSLPLGLIMTLLRKSRFAPVRVLMKALISILRGTPLMLQLIAVAYGPFYIARSLQLTGVAKDIAWLAAINPRAFSFSDKLTPIILGFSVNYAAYFAEIYRGGIESIPVGQYEAASVLGYSHAQTFMRIILPQVVKRIIPSVTNEVITLVKDTSMAFTLAYQEMFSIGKQIANSQSSFMPFIIAGAFYYVFNFIVAFVMGLVEKRLNYYR